MEYSEQMLVLQVGSFKESDVWVRLLSPTKGLFSAFAFGGSRSKRRFSGCLDLFNNVLFRMKSERSDSYVTLQEGVLIQGVSRLRSDFPRFGIAQNCAKFLLAFDIHQEGASKAYSLFLSTLEVLEKEGDIPAIFPLYFRARLAFDHGYALDIDTCNTCGAPLSQLHSVFFVYDGALHCTHCARNYSGSRVHLDPEAYRTLLMIIKESPLEWSSIDISANVKSVIATAIDGFIQYHVGLHWDRGRFVKV